MLAELKTRRSGQVGFVPRQPSWRRLGPWCRWAWLGLAVGSEGRAGGPDGGGDL